MKISRRQLKLIESLNNDQEKANRLYKPGPYWSYKCKKASDWILKKGFDDFRGLNSPVATSYGDNLILDKRNEFGLNFKSRILIAISNLPIIKKLYQNQLQLTKNNIEKFLRYQNFFYQQNKRVEYLINNYNLDQTTLFESVNNFEYKGKLYSCLYLVNLNILDEISKIIDLRNINSVFEIGGGFGSNIHIMLQNFKNIKKIIYMDISPNLFIGTEYLRYFYKDAVKDYVDTKDKEIKFLNNNDLEIFCLPPWQLPNISSRIDYFHNASSFQEMTKEIIINYSNYISKILKDKGSISLIYYNNDNPKTVKIDEIKNIFSQNFSEVNFPILTPLDVKMSLLYKINNDLSN